MTEEIPVNLLEGWINELRSSLKQECQEANSGRDLSIKQGMREGLGVIQHKITTWLRHQNYVQTLLRSGRKFLMVRRVNLSEGRFRKLEWYEGDLFLTLAWRHGMYEEKGELALEMEDTKDLSRTILVYRGALTFDDLAGLARVGGVESVKNTERRGEWVEQI